MVSGQESNFPQVSKAISRPIVLPSWAPMGRGRSGFTLIELLVVVAIIAILAAIAVPNFLEAQTCSKVARVRANHRTLAMALETYAIDTNGYPSAESNGTVKWLRWMTTPVAYLTSVHLEDPFTGPEADPDDLSTLRSYPYVIMVSTSEAI
jgi:prepilin-type N-terminal cleavage/methylation domain-containing protein